MNTWIFRLPYILPVLRSKPKPFWLTLSTVDLASFWWPQLACNRLLHALVTLMLSEGSSFAANMDFKLSQCFRLRGPEATRKPRTSFLWSTSTPTSEEKVFKTQMNDVTAFGKTLCPWWLCCCCLLTIQNVFSPIELYTCTCNNQYYLKWTVNSRVCVVIYV